MSHLRWNLLPPVPDKYLSSASGFYRLIVQLLYNRGFTDSSDMHSFITGGKDLLNNPFLLPEMHQAVSWIYQALISGKKIAVYGDYDTDGVTATALLVQGLSLLGGNVVPYIPHRQFEGYGLTINALESLHRQGVSLIITVDCGITNVSEVKKAREMGLDIIITDHHTPSPEIPSAIAVINPRTPNSRYPFKNLTGVGVAYKLLQALFQSKDQELQLKNMLELVALGTIADISPLVGENRYFVKEGLQIINTDPRPGVKELIKQSKLTVGNLDTRNISWVIVPCLNAVGRLAHALPSYDLLMTDNYKMASELAQLLLKNNVERQKLTVTSLANAREKVLSQGISTLLMTDDEDYPLGITGLVAGRLSEEFYRPAIVVKTGEEVSTGSCRSIPEFNIIAALNQFHDLLSRFGGHSQAAGFTLPTKNLTLLEQRLSYLATAQLQGADLRPHLDIDALMNLRDLGGDTFQSIQTMAPFGCGNPVPVFLSRGVEVVDSRTMGNNSNHLRLKVRMDGSVWDGVGFRLGNHQTEITPRINIVYNLEVDNWKGKENLRLNIQDFASSSRQ